MRQALFAPWRMEFIENHEKADGCVLCSIPQETEKNLYVLHRGKLSYLVLNKYPYTHGHLMVVPYRHERDWTKMTRDELAEIGEITQKALVVLQKVVQAQGFNLGVNLGRAAGAGIESHVHQHIVPRWTGDFNFMPLFSEAKVISEHLVETHRKLKEAWDQI